MLHERLSFKRPSQMIVLLVAAGLLLSVPVCSFLAYTRSQAREPAAEVHQAPTVQAQEPTSSPAEAPRAVKLPVKAAPHVVPSKWPWSDRWVTVGSVMWRVTDVELRQEMSSPYGTTVYPSGGHFVIVSVDGRLVTKESGTISAMQFKLVDDAGRVFRPDTDAEMALGDEMFFIEQIHPGMTEWHRIAFDISAASRSLKLRIEDLQFFSDAVGYVGLGSMSQLVQAEEAMGSLSLPPGEVLESLSLPHDQAERWATLDARIDTLNAEIAR